MANQKPMSWEDVGKGFLNTIGPSSWNAAVQTAKGIGSAIQHPIQTVQNLGELGKGALSMAEGAAGVPQDQAQKARDEAVAKAAWQQFASKYGTLDPKTGQLHLDMETIKHTLATNPASVLQDVSTALPMFGGAVGALGDVANVAGDVSKVGALSDVGSALKVAGKTANTVGNAVNPVTAPIAATASLAKNVGRAVPFVGGMGSAIGNMPAEAYSAATSVPRPLLRAAYQSGTRAADQAVNDAGETPAQVFQRFQSKQGSPQEIQDVAIRGVNATKKAASDNYLSGKESLSKQPVDLTPIGNSLIEQANELARGAPSGWQQAKNAYDAAFNHVLEIVNNPDPASKTIDNIDALKQQIWDLQKQTSNPKAQQVLGSIYNATREAMSNTDPAYTALMEQYQTGLRNINDVAANLGAKGTVTATNALAKQLKALKTGAGQSLFDQLAEQEPSLPFMLAGTAAQDWLPHGKAIYLEGMGALGSGYAALQAGQPWSALGIPAFMVAQSPKVALNAAQLAGKASNILSSAANGVGSVAPVGATLAAKYEDQQEQKPLTPQEANISPAYYTGQPAPPTDQQMTQPPDQGITPEQAWSVPDADSSPSPQADGGRIGFATGGTVDHFDAHHERLLSRLMGRIEKAKKDVKQSTKPLLYTPDSVVAKALAVAQKSI